MAIVVVAPTLIIAPLIILVAIPPITGVGVGGKGTHIGEHPAGDGRLGCWGTNGRKRHCSH